MAQRRKVSLMLFLVSILCFFLPFITVSCNGKRVATLTGVQLAIGTTVAPPQMFGPRQKRKVEPEPLATFAALSALVSLGLVFLRNRSAIAPAISGAAGVLFMLLLKSKLSSNMTRTGAQGMFNLQFESGYTMALLSLVAGAGWSLYGFVLSSKETDAAPTASLKAGPETVDARLTGRSCPSCGAMMGDGKFCPSCGKAAA
jgi:hypothetical protein